MLGSPILYLKGMRILMFQLSGFCYRVWGLGMRDSILGIRDLGIRGLGFRVSGLGV